MKTYTITHDHLHICFHTETLHFSIETENTNWEWCSDYQPSFTCMGETVFFSQAENISHQYLDTGIGTGILSHYDTFCISGITYAAGFETFVWLEYATGDVHFEWIPLSEDDAPITGVNWPGSMRFDEKKASWYTLLTLWQGLLIPNDWNEELSGIPFAGHLGTCAAYMPWFGQIKEGCGYLAICEQPADASYFAEHPANGPYTHVGINWHPSLGKMNYRRTMCYRFFADCDYNTLCKSYRAYTIEHDTFRSLREKSAKAPVEKLFGSMFVHAGIKTKVQPDSNFYDKDAPLKNNHVTPFAQRTKEIRHYHDDLGIEKLYLHLDGWAEPGYDNQHPDYLPACEEAGGWDGMKTLCDTLHDCGYLFGIHDQYRDYYFAAKTFDLRFATQNPDGSYPEHANWAGGHQTYLCATQAPYYVKRNFKEIAAHGIDLDCAYLDVFTCNEGDECAHPWHRMTREECYRYRGQCFSYLLSNGILPSSEEVTDWSIPTLVFCHYAPYDFMMRKPGSPKMGLPVPLFNLVYHDCLIIPWMMEKYEAEDYMLYALLNGGAPYFIRNGAYQNTDGSFDDDSGLSEAEMVSRCQTVAALHEKIAGCEMLSHDFVDGNAAIQRTRFADGTTVTVDFCAGTYQISDN